MADDNGDDDIFADLYDADEVPAPKPSVAVPVAAQPAQEATLKTPSQTVTEYDHNMSGDSYTDQHPGGDDRGWGTGAQQGGSVHEDRPIGIKEDGKMFIGGLNWDTTDQSMRDYFSQFGEVIECTVMRDSTTGRSRGFGFLTFRDPKCVNTVMVKEHHLDGKIIDPKRAIPRDEQEKTSKIFVGGISQEASEEQFKEYFQQFGRVLDATLMMDKDTGRPRGFGFVTFDNEAAVDALLHRHLEILGKPIEVKKAQPRGNVREREEDTKPYNRNRFDNGSSQQQGMAAAGGMYGSNMSPQMMAQYWQRMQQYFAMMQTQLAAQGGAGGAGMMNPMMMQQMQAMQMQQMQQMQAMQANGNQGVAAVAAAGSDQGAKQDQGTSEDGQEDGSSAGKGGKHHGFSPYEQQMFEQQKYTAGGGAGVGRGQASGPSAWEGMYDDVPQPANPIAPSGPRGGMGFQNSYRGGRGGYGQRQGSDSPAPSSAVNAPAGAPTGPKNAGKPGANYRGGARGGSHRFHPYGR